MNDVTQSIMTCHRNDDSQKKEIDSSQLTFSIKDFENTRLSTCHILSTIINDGKNVILFDNK